MREYKEPHEINEEDRKAMEWGLRNPYYRLERILLELEKDNPELYEAREVIREREREVLYKDLLGAGSMNIHAAIPKATKIITQIKRLIYDFKAIKQEIAWIHDFYYDPDYKDSKEIRCHKTNLNKMVYEINIELDGIKVILDEILEDMDSKECDDWKVRG